jgi:hypothetical protein
MSSTAHLTSLPAIVVKTFDPSSEVRGFSWFIQVAVPAMTNELRRGPSCCANDWLPKLHRLNRDASECLRPGAHEPDVSSGDQLEWTFLKVDEMD